MVWGGISLDNKTGLIFIRGNLTAERYVEEVVQNHTLLFAHEIGPDFVLMQDGARAHTSTAPHAPSKTREFRSCIGPHAVQTSIVLNTFGI